MDRHLIELSDVSNNTKELLLEVQDIMTLYILSIYESKDSPGLSSYPLFSYELKTGGWGKISWDVSTDTVPSNHLADFNPLLFQFDF